MVTFNFQLPDDEAELLLSCIQDSVGNCLMMQIEHQKNKPVLEALEKHAKVLDKILDVVARGSRR